MWARVGADLSGSVNLEQAVTMSPTSVGGGQYRVLVTLVTGASVHLLPVHGSEAAAMDQIEALVHGGAS